MVLWDEIEDIDDDSSVPREGEEAMPTNHLKASPIV